MTIPLPPTNTKRPIAWYDTECYPNYWLLKLHTEHEQTYTFELRAGQVFTVVDRQRIYTLFQLFTVVSFNGINYDVPMIGGALLGYDPTQLKTLNDRIIVGGEKHWELGIDWKPDDHIDIMEVAPATGSQKMYAGRIHSKRMQDLPYDPSTVLTEEQIVEVSAYCSNDLQVLRELYTALIPQIEQRIGLSARYGIDLRSKSDAQLAEAVIKHRCEQAVGRRLYKPEIDWNLKFKYRAPAYIGFSMPQLQRALQLATEATFRLGPNGAVEMPPELNDLAIKIGNSVYRMGIGGLHSSEKQAVHIADDEYELISPDVASYYPSLIINSGKYPPALGETFLSEYSKIKKDRLIAKQESSKIKKRLELLEKELLDAKTREKIS
jgi:hypothetical protein